MRALVMTKPGEFTLQEQPQSEPKKDELLLKVLCLEICGTDLHAKEITLMAGRNAAREDFAGVVAGIESGRVDTSGFATRTASLETAAAQFPLWIKPEPGCIKAAATILS
jgi:threonine dehydrogenase-like Zn-dependent dehydrogenase